MHFTQMTLANHWSSSEETLALMGKAFQPHVFFEVVRLLDFDDAVSFHDAFPLLRKLWDDHTFYVRWFHGHVGWGEPNDTIVRLAGVSNYFQKIDFESYVQHVHWHLHGRLVSRGQTPRYRTDILQYMGMAPLDRHFAVKDCIFLPKTAPGVFSGNLALLGTEGELALFHAGNVEYVLTASLQLEFSPESLMCSPDGSLLVASSEMGFTTLVTLTAEGTPRGVVTRIKISSVNFHRSCFVDERSFLAWSETEDPDEWSVNRHVLYGSNVQKYNFVDHASLGQLFQPIPGFYDRFVPVLMYKKVSPGLPDFALFWEKVPGGYSNRLRVVGDPSGSAPRRRRDYYHTFRHCRVCSASFSSDQEFVFVLVICEMAGDFFFTHEEGERLEREPPLDHSSLGRVTSRSGRCAFYRMAFDDRGISEVVPRFYSGSWVDPETRPFPHHWKRLHNFDKAGEMSFICTKTHLALKYKEGVMCHFAHISGQLSQPCYDDVNAPKLFAISEDHRHHAHFLGDQPYWKEMLGGYRECSKYDKSFRIHRHCQPVRVPHLVVSLNYT